MLPLLYHKRFYKYQHFIAGVATLVRVQEFEVRAPAPGRLVVRTTLHFAQWLQVLVLLLVQAVVLALY